MNTQHTPTPGSDAWLYLAYAHYVRTQLRGSSAAHIMAKRIYRRAQDAVNARAALAKVGA